MPQRLLDEPVQRLHATEARHDPDDDCAGTLVDHFLQFELKQLVQLGLEQLVQHRLIRP